MAVPARAHGPVSALALALTDIHKSFGDTRALDGATCHVRRGSIHALLGENGAGKTTLMRIAFGMIPADRGTYERSGRPVRFASERDSISAGIGMVHQHFMLIPAFTVAENVALGGHGRFRASDAVAAVRRVGEATGLALDPHARVADLPIGAQQRAEIVRALARNADTLILDEPTAVLTPSESEDLYRWMRRFAAAGGTVVLITHRVREALGVADDVTVLRRGRTVLTGAADALEENAVVAAIVGDALAADGAAPLDATDGPVVFALQGASVRDAAGRVRLRATDLVVRAGEVLGVLGVEGAGQRELLRVLAGRIAPTSGSVQRPATVGFVPEDRLEDAVIPEFTLTENLALAHAGTLRGRVDWAQEHRVAERVIAQYDVRAAGAEAAMRSLSGGNQQRFVVGRERHRAPQALVAENPTRGLDVRATARVLATIRELARAGQGAAVVYSTDLDEILALTRRIVVCFDGTVREVAPPADPTDRSPYARALVGADA
ncbi:ATP-binding cassette domain-containing protein [Pseudogemmatithrix spongiicola]|uniref:ATP-binding cassette domain-containing protein n=1 Tax=Pseudogemmatithrix spongiicola TaxID=3062599 RepID=A0AA49Q6H8_9BACT|nr:ATP-binding cassette domain-containing protein [Gemmatimonadaceae bacterium 'strain 138']WKW13694.1 ATP-binding cassette domain-containing protein [Gemmatimonadaceae bacterium 'strain 318']